MIFCARSKRWEAVGPTFGRRLPASRGQKRLPLLFHHWRASRAKLAAIWAHFSRRPTLFLGQQRPKRQLMLTLWPPNERASGLAGWLAALLPACSLGDGKNVRDDKRSGAPNDESAPLPAPPRARASSLSLSLFYWRQADGGALAATNRRRQVRQRQRQ